jgi:hypothetical protein
MKIEALSEIREYIINAFAAHVEVKQLKKDLAELYGKTYNLKYLSTQKYRFKAEIAEKRKELNQNVQEIPIANLYWRLARRQEMIETIKGQSYRQGAAILYQVANAILDSTARELSELTGQGWEGTLLGLMQMSADQFRAHIQQERVPGNFLPSPSERPQAQPGANVGAMVQDEGSVTDAGELISVATGASQGEQERAGASEPPPTPVPTPSGIGSHPIQGHPSPPLFPPDSREFTMERNFLNLVIALPVKKKR